VEISETELQASESFISSMSSQLVPRKFGTRRAGWSGIRATTLCTFWPASSWTGIVPKAS